MFPCPKAVWTNLQKQTQEEIEAAADAAATSHTQYIDLQRTASEQTRKNEVLTDELEATSAAGVILRKELSELRHLAVEQRGVVMAAKAETDKAKEEKEHMEGELSVVKTPVK